MLKATVPRQGRVSTALSWRNVAAVAGRGWTACTRLRRTAARARSGIVSLDEVEGGHLMLLPCVVCLPLLLVMVEWVWMGQGRHDGNLVDEVVIHSLLL